MIAEKNVLKSLWTNEYICDTRVIYGNIIRSYPENTIDTSRPA